MQEILTVKSDDTVGRVKTYEAIVKGQNVPKAGIPESFKVLIKEMQSLCLDMKVLDEAGDEIDLKQNFDDDDIPRHEAAINDDISFEDDGTGDNYVDPDSADDGYDDLVGDFAGDDDDLAGDDLLSGETDDIFGDEDDE